MEDPYPYNAKQPNDLSLVRALGAVGLMASSLALASLIFLVLRLLWNIDAARPGQVPVDAPVPGYWFELAAGMFGCGLAILLLTASAGAIRFRTWARPAMIVYGVISVVLGAVGLIFHVHWLIEATTNHSGIGLPQAMRTPEAAAEWACWMFGTILGVAMLYAMNRPDVKLAFEEGGDTPHNMMASN